MRGDRRPRMGQKPGKRLSLLSIAIGAAAAGALAVGAVAVGAIAVGALAVGKARFGKVEIEELTVRRLHVLEESETSSERPSTAPLPPREIRTPPPRFRGDPGIAGEVARQGRRGRKTPPSTTGG
jgi:hypothetical protein